MSDTNAPPDYDFADKDTLVGMLRHTYRKMLMKTDDMLPASIIAYNRISNVATVQPQIKILTTNNKLISRAPLVNVPVFALGGGNFVINFPLAQGDTGWIKASDRDISLYIQSAAESGPNTNRLHSFEDGLFLPDVMAKYTINEADESNLVIQSLDGSTKISIGIGNIELVASNVAIQSTAIALTSSTLTHNGQNIGSTHKHPYNPGTGASTETGAPNA